MTNLRRITPVEAFQEALQSDWLDMSAAVDAAEEAKRQAEQLSIRLLAENDMLRDQLTHANAELKVWKAYAVAVDTKLEVAANIIQGARNDARIEAREKANEPAAVEPPKVAEARIANHEPPQARQTPIPTTMGQIAQDDDGAAAIIAQFAPKMPANQFSSVK